MSMAKGCNYSVHCSIQEQRDFCNIYQVREMRVEYLHEVNKALLEDEGMKHTSHASSLASWMLCAKSIKETSRNGQRKWEHEDKLSALSQIETMMACNLSMERDIGSLFMYGLFRI